MKIAISTSGGDAPGLNAVIRGATSTAIRRGHEVFGIRNGFESLLKDDQLIPLNERTVDGIERTGGTILGAASGGNPFAGGRTVSDFVQALRKHGVEALLCIGGDGTMRIAHQVSMAGIRVIGVPKTIDRDVPTTWTTFGFDSAVERVMRAVDDLHSTTAAHKRLMIVEVMGRDAGWIALYGGIGGGAHMIALPEFPFDVAVFAQHVLQREADGDSYHIMVVSEGAFPQGGKPIRDDLTGSYGGVSRWIGAELRKRTGKEVRTLTLGHLQRGGAPTVFDRVLGLRFGSAAISALDRGESDVMIAFQPPAMTTVPLMEIAGKTNLICEETHELRTAQNMGICFGI